MREYLKKLRQEMKMTHLQAAKKARMSRTSYVNIESGKRQLDMSLSILEKLSKVFDISIEELAKCEKDYLKAKNEDF